MTTALLIIDMQTAMCKGTYAAYDIQAVTQRINQLSAAARAAGRPVFVVQHGSSDGPLVENTEGWQLSEELVVDPGDQLVHKRTPNSFHGTTLQGLLQRHGVRKLVICGLQTEFCVDTTVRQALSLGYDVVLVEDGHSTLDNPVLSAAQIRDHHNYTLSHFQSFDGDIVVKPAAAIAFAD